MVNQPDRMATFFYELTRADTEGLIPNIVKTYTALIFIEQTMEDVLSVPVRFVRGEGFRGIHQKIP